MKPLLKKMTYARKEKATLPPQSAEPEALKKALERARTEKERQQAIQTVGSLVAGNVKRVKKVKHK